MDRRAEGGGRLRARTAAEVCSSRPGRKKKKKEKKEKSILKFVDEIKSFKRHLQIKCAKVGRKTDRQTCERLEN